MKCRYVVGPVAAAIVICVSAPAEAVDVVSRKGDESPAQGTVTAVDQLGVTVKPRIGSETTVPANEIESVRWDGEPAKLNLARVDEAGGRLEKALAAYQEIAADNSLSNSNLKLAVQFLIARTTAKMALADPSKLDEAARLLEEFGTAGIDFYRYYESRDYLGRIYMAQEEYQKAQAAFESLAQAPWSDYKMAAESAKARLLLQQGKTGEALAAFDAVIAADAKGPGELSRRYEAMLGRATCLIRQQRHEDALKTLDQVVTQASPNDAALQAEAYVRQGDCLQALGRTKEAVLAYLHVDVLFAQEKSLHAEALYHLARLWGTVGQPERGADARAALESGYPNSDWLKKLANAGG